MKALNIGCGPWLFPKPWINADKLSGIGADEIMDLDDLYWPWDDNSFDQVWANHCLEHADRISHVIEELWRICKPGALIQIRLPWCEWEGYWDDCTHRSHWTIETLTWYEQGHPHHGALPFKHIEFEVLRKELRDGWELVWDLAVVKPGCPSLSESPIPVPQAIAQGENAWPQ